ncbi:PAS domain S-box protein [Novosphingobium sp. M1R2S20]|uniref:histidine kinase n=1 Tax=Novosphingobium rhizovicinum TaxID=3228928 RepID=A0ABV3RC82_9SPHN
MKAKENSLWESIALSDPTPVSAFDHGFRLIAFNQAYRDEIKLISRGALKVGDRLCDLIPEDQCPDMLSNLSRALAGEAFREWGAQQRNETVGPIGTIYFAPVRDVGGQIIGAFCRYESLAQHGRSEDDPSREHIAAATNKTGMRPLALGRESFPARTGSEESVKRFQIMAESAPVMMWATDADGKCAYLNRPWYEYTGKSEADGFDWMSAIHPDDYDLAVRDFRYAQTHHQYYRNECRIRGADGISRWMICVARPQFLGDGSILGYVGAIIDIHDRVAAQESIKRNEVQLRLATDAAQIGLWELDVAAKMLSCSSFVRSMFGISHDNPISTAEFYSLLHPDDVDHVRQAATAAADPVLRELYDVEYRVTVKGNDTFRWISAKGRGIFNKGECERVIGIVQDITDKKSYEFELKRLNENLEFRVEEELGRRIQAEDLLRQARKMEAIGQVTGGIAHDFNNLLMAIRGNLELIELTLPKDDKLISYLNNAISAVDVGTKITAQLLAFSRSQKISVRPVELTPVLVTARDLIGNALGPNISISMDLRSPAVWVLTDPEQLELALLNLAVNARDAMPDGGSIRIESAASVRANGGKRDEKFVCISVNDTGSGMSPEVLKKATEPFFTTKGIGKGTGLGLAQVYSFIRQCGGDMRLRSRVGEGTTVELLLPRTSQQVDEGKDQEECSAKDAVLHRASGVVVIVDDDDHVRPAIAAALEGIGFTVHQAADGPSGIELIRKTKPSVAIIDFVMPDTNGAEVARAAHLIHPKLPIVFVSGYCDTEELHQIPGALVLGKPFTLDTLRRTVMSAIS